MRFLAAILFASLAIFTGCGGGGSSNKLTVTISPTASTLTQNQTVQFTATVANATNTAVTWQVNSTTGGSSTVGTISTSGLYTAPSSIASAFSVTVTAVSEQDTTQSASAAVTLNPTNAAPTPPILVSPSSATLPAGAQQTFTATASGNSVAVVWSVGCNGQTGAVCGTITQNGVYTAPLFPPPGGGAVVTASTSDSSALPGNAPVTVQISNQSLFGTYAFTASGKAGGNFASVAGSVTFDGQGGVTGGVEDTLGAASATITGGSYHVGSDGRGNLTLQTSAGPSTWQFILVNHSQVLLESFDASPVLSGALDAQDSTAFNAGAIQGNYSFLLSGAGGGNAIRSLNAAGAFAADGAGGLGSGFYDVNNAGTAATNLALTGSFTAPANTGRGTLTLSSSFGTQSFVYYVVDATHLKLMETDGTTGCTGEALKQVAGPFGNSSLHGVFVAALGGTDVHGAASTGTILTLDGAGGVTGKIDTNNNGNLQNNVAVAGTYSVTDAATGRATLSWNAPDGTHQFAVYPSAAGKLNIVEVDAASESATAVMQPFSGTFGSFSGNFSVQASGSALVSFPGEETFLGRMVPNGGSSISGTLAVNSSGTTVQPLGLQASYSFDNSGRALVTGSTSSDALRTPTFIFYAADANTAVFIEFDSDRVMTGAILRQY